jgi:hypothetical protein
MSGRFAPRSWHHLDREAPEHRLPEALRRRDPKNGAECGWVEQMQLLLAEFSSRGQCVLDPFAGFGTTLVACAIEQREAWGVELRAERFDLIGERMRGFPQSRHHVLHGDAGELSAPDASIDLVLTSLPYFEPPAGSTELGPAYQAHLEMLARVFARQRRAMRMGALFVAAAQNLHLGGRFIPFAWDVARILGAQLTLCDERVLVYDRKRPASADVTVSNRSHEYVLVARRDDPPVDLDEALSVLAMLSVAGSFVVIGGLALALVAPEALDRPPADVDIVVPEWVAELEPFVKKLLGAGFAVSSWGEPVYLPLSESLVRDRIYLRAVRDHLVIDLTFASPAVLADLQSHSVAVRGVSVASPAKLRQLLEKSGRPRDLARAKAIAPSGAGTQTDPISNE